MKKPVKKLVLLPGMDGSGELLRGFTAALPKELVVEMLWYPADRWMDYRELAGALRGAIGVDEPFVLMAESFGAPLAVLIAAMAPPNLRGVALCAGFATGPVRGWKKELALKLGPLASRVEMPAFVARYLLAGDMAPRDLVDSVKRAMSWVTPKVLSARLREMLTVDVRTDMARIRVPMLYLQPARDRLVDAVCVEEMQHVKAARVVQVDGPHLLLLAEPAPCADAVAAFVRELGCRDLE